MSSILSSKSITKKTHDNTKLKTFLILVAMMLCSILYVQVQEAQCTSRVLSFVQIGDTQSANETQLQSIVDFIFDNKVVLDIQYVVHMGDIVGVYNNETNWKIGNTAFSQLTDYVAFGWLAGDNDGESAQYLGDNYYAFNASNYPNMTSSYDQGRNTAQFFNFSGIEILFVNLEYFANENALQWFESLYQQYENAIVIFSTHSYLDFVGDYTEDTINSTYLDAYPRVKLVLCGHLVYAIHQEANGRQEILFNYQRVLDYFPDLSDFVRVYTVFDDGTVDAWTYSQLRDTYLTDSANQFSFNLFDPIPTPAPTTTSPSTPSPTPKQELSPTDSPAPTPTLPPSETTTPTPAETPDIPEFAFPLTAAITLAIVIGTIIALAIKKRR